MGGIGNEIHVDLFPHLVLGVLGGPFRGGSCRLAAHLIEQAEYRGT